MGVKSTKSIEQEMAEMAEANTISPLPPVQVFEAKALTTCP